MDPPGPQDLDSLIVHLHRILVTHSDVEELRTLCFQLRIAYDDLPGAGKSGRARELLSFLDRRRRIAELIVIGKRERPDIDWPDPPDFSPRLFINRERELKLLNLERLRASQSPYVLINAPAGYGKSYLLQHLLDSTQADAVVSQEWCLRSIDMRRPVAEQVDHMVQAITGRAPHNGSATTVDAVCDYMLQELTAPTARGRRALLLMLDSVERLDETATPWLHALLHQLWRRTRPGQQEILTVRVLIAGRDVEAFWEGFERDDPRPPAPQRVQLLPFDAHAIRELIWEQAQAEKIFLDDQTVDEIADQVAYLGGGHPQIIRSLVDQVAEKSFAISPVVGFFEQHCERLAQTCITPVAGALLESLDPRLGQIVRVLGVFRCVNANTLQALIEGGMLPSEINAITLLGELQRAQLLTGPGIKDPFYRDPVLRRVWALDMAHRSPESRAQHQRLNQLALELYAAWIENLGQELPETPLKAAQRLLSVVEWLFHALQAATLDQEWLRAGLKGHVEILSTGEQTLSVAELIVNEMTQDEELCYLARQRLGAGEFDTLCSWMKGL
jgi:hypothetical protein